MYLHILVAGYLGALVSLRLGLVLLGLAVAVWLWAAWGASRLGPPSPHCITASEAALAGAKAQACRGGCGRQESDVVITVEDGHLRGVLAVPGKGASDLGVVVTHPWRVMGGNVDNNVPFELTRVMADMGHHALRFNFRGLGVSQGKREVSDLVAAARWLLKNGAGVRRIVLVGYSHGSIVAGAAAKELGETLAGLVTISPPWPWAWFLFLGNGEALFRAGCVSKPKLFLLGSWDVFLPPSFWRRRLADVPQPKRAVLVQGCGHFWNGSELGLAGQIAEWIAKDL